MIRTIYSALGVMLLTAGFYAPSMVVATPAVAEIRIDIGVPIFRWRRERPYYRRWAAEQRWERERRWEELRDEERRSYWEWRHKARGHRHHRW